MSYPPVAKSFRVCKPSKRRGPGYAATLGYIGCSGAWYSVRLITTWKDGSVSEDLFWSADKVKALNDAEYAGRFYTTEVKDRVAYVNAYLAKARGRSTAKKRSRALVG